MKRLYVSVVALLSMTMAFAGNGNETKNANDSNVCDSTATGKGKTEAAYDINYNLRRMGETLGLTLSQMNSVDALNRSFNDDLKALVGAADADRKALLDNEERTSDEVNALAEKLEQAIDSLITVYVDYDIVDTSNGTEGSAYRNHQKA